MNTRKIKQTLLVVELCRNMAAALVLCGMVFGTASDALALTPTIHSVTAGNTVTKENFL